MRLLPVALLALAAPPAAAQSYLIALPRIALPEIEAAVPVVEPPEWPPAVRIEPPSRSRGPHHWLGYTRPARTREKRFAILFTAAPFERTSLERGWIRERSERR